MNRNKLINVPVFNVGVIFLAISIAYSQENSSQHISNRQTVAQVKNVSVRLSDFGHFLSLRPLPAYSAIDEELIYKRLDEYIVNELLYREALRLELDKDPRIHYSIQQLLVQSLIEKQIHDPIRSEQVTDQQIRAYYDLHIDEYERPEQRRIAMIRIPVTDSDSADKKRAASPKARQLLNDIQQSQSPVLGFRQLAEQSGDNSITTDFFSQSSTLPHPGVVQEAFALDRNGQINPAPIESKDGYYLIMLIGKRSAMRKDFDSQKEIIRQLIIQDKIRQAEETLIQTLKKDSEIKINPAAVADIVASLKKQQRSQSESVLTTQFSNDTKENNDEK